MLNAATPDCVKRGQLPRAIENGVTKAELVELITHLAFYAGWPNAMSAVAKAKELP